MRDELPAHGMWGLGSPSGVRLVGCRVGSALQGMDPPCQP